MLTAWSYCISNH